MQKKARSPSGGTKRRGPPFPLALQATGKRRAPDSAHQPPALAEATAKGTAPAPGAGAREQSYCYRPRGAAPGSVCFHAEARGKHTKAGFLARASPLRLLGASAPMAYWREPWGLEPIQDLPARRLDGDFFVPLRYCARRRIQRPTVVGGFWAVGKIPANSAHQEILNRLLPPPAHTAAGPRRLCTCLSYRAGGSHRPRPGCSFVRVFFGTKCSRFPGKLQGPGFRKKGFQTPCKCAIIPH